MTFGNIAGVLEYDGVEWNLIPLKNRCDRTEYLGYNNIFKKPQISYNYFELVINPKGEIIHYLTQKPKHIPLSKQFVK